MIIRLLTYSIRKPHPHHFIANVILFGVDEEEIIEIEGRRRSRRRFRCLFIGAWKNVYIFQKGEVGWKVAVKACCIFTSSFFTSHHISNLQEI